MNKTSVPLGATDPKIKDLYGALVDMGDSGLIVDEETANQELEILESCKAVKSSVQDGSFLQDEALEAYQVTYNDYQAYLAENVFTCLGGSRAWPFPNNSLLISR